MTRRLDQYTQLWEREAKAMTAHTSFRSSERDINVPVPAPWHFGPAPAGWGAELAPPPSNYYGQSLTTLGRLGNTGATIGLDPRRRPADVDPETIIVTTLWAQRALRGRGLYRGAIDGQAGPQTMAALEEARSRTADTRLPQQVPLRNERPLAFSGPWASAVGIGRRTEEWLSRAPVIADPPPASGGSGGSLTPDPSTTATPSASETVSIALPLLVLGGGLALLFSRR